MFQYTRFAVSQNSAKIMWYIGKILSYPAVACIHTSSSKKLQSVINTISAMPLSNVKIGGDYML